MRQVDVGILAVGREGAEQGGGGEDVCGDEWQAVVRREDVRATEKEKVVCGEGFRVGDVVRAVVVRGFSLSPSLSFLLSGALSLSRFYGLGRVERDGHDGGKGYGRLTMMGEGTDQSRRPVELLSVYGEE